MTRASQVRLAAHLPASPRLLYIVGVRLLVLFAQTAGDLLLAGAFLGNLKLLAAELVGQTEHAAADCRAVSSVFTLTAAAGNLLRKVPELAFCQQVASCGVSGASPGWVQLNARRDFGVLGLDHVNHLVFFESSVRVLERFLVHRFKVREVALVVKSLSELLRMSAVCLFYVHNVAPLTSWALFCALDCSTQMSFDSSGGLSPINETAANQLASINGQIRKQ